MQKVRPKKSLGQHFLNDLNIAKKIADSLTQEGLKSIIEVGPGMGVLTQYLIKTPLPFYAIEIDTESIDYLKREFPNREFIVEGDVLRKDISIYPSPCGIIGNFPYNISSQIFFKVLENKGSVQEVVCMIQKEVAERIASPHGNKTYGILSVFLQTYYDIEYLFTVHEDSFNPPPRVKSAVIKLSRNDRTDLGCNEKLFFQVVKQAFNQRRKTMRNSLKTMTSGMDTSADVFNLRPEQLSPDELLSLTRLIENEMKKME